MSAHIDRLEQDEWVLACAQAILDKDSLIAPEDAQDLALGLWDRRSCQTLAPAHVVELLFQSRLSSVSRGDAHGLDER